MLAKTGRAGRLRTPKLAFMLGAQPSIVASKCHVEGRAGRGTGSGAGFSVGRSAAVAAPAESVAIAAKMVLASPVIRRPRLPIRRAPQPHSRESLVNPLSAGKVDPGAANRFCGALRR